MWYFAWILGIGLAVAFGVLNGVWHEFRLFDDGDHGHSEPDPVVPPVLPTPGT
tara:strand:- start:162 stop:320 length:159 start_codon:yes stop_codon:yes gene_type:complete